jgi:hypothetical protein
VGILEQQVAAGARAAVDDAAREERIANREMEFSDGFVSSWAAGLTQQKGALARAILEDGGGKAWFWRVELIDAVSGEKIEGAKLIEGQYGEVWVNSGKARFIGRAKRKATMEAKGVLERIVVFRVDAVADIFARGNGLSGAASARAIVRPADSAVKYEGRAGIARDSVEGWIERARENGMKWQEIVIEE